MCLEREGVCVCLERVGECTERERERDGKCVQREGRVCFEIEREMECV